MKTKLIEKVKIELKKKETIKQAIYMALTQITFFFLILISGEPTHSGPTPAINLSFSAFMPLIITIIFAIIIPIFISKKFYLWLFGFIVLSLCFHIYFFLNISNDYGFLNLINTYHSFAGAFFFYIIQLIPYLITLAIIRIKELGGKD